jgi:hypothetical protein
VHIPDQKDVHLKLVTTPKPNFVAATPLVPL